MPGKASTSSGNVGPHMLSRAVVVTTIGSFSAFAALAKANHVVFQLACRIVTDAGHKADLVINEDKIRVFGSQRFVRAGLMCHTIEFASATVGRIGGSIALYWCM